MNFLLFADFITGDGGLNLLFFMILFVVPALVLTLMIPIGIWNIHKSIDEQTKELKELVETQNLILSKLIDKENNNTTSNS